MYQEVFCLRKIYVLGVTYVIYGLDRGFLGEFSARFRKEVRKKKAGRRIRKKISIF